LSRWLAEIRANRLPEAVSIAKSFVSIGSSDTHVARVAEAAANVAGAMVVIHDKRLPFAAYGAFVSLGFEDGCNVISAYRIEVFDALLAIILGGTRGILRSPVSKSIVAVLLVIDAEGARGLS